MEGVPLLEVEEGRRRLRDLLWGLESSEEVGECCRLCRRVPLELSRGSPWERLAGRRRQ